ncbi:MAG: hypothetical protein KF812_13265 [Fimbriimonadaceae bacterium]|nr:hypothetical protein [Fimbriimonadaceae bacterium]
MRRRLRDLWFKKPEKGPVQLSRDFFLTVLAAKLPLPAPLVILNPKGEGGAVEGFIAPLGEKVEKERLSQPLERGAYAIASPDQKTVIRLTVVSKEEAGYDPSHVLSNPFTENLDPEIRSRIAGTWTLLQLTFESYDPAAYPAVDFLLRVAQRLAELTDGTVADTVSMVYRSAQQVRAETPPDQPLAIQNVVATHAMPLGNDWLVVTSGLAKIGHPEVEIRGIDEDNVPIAEHFLAGVALTIWKGAQLEIGVQIGEKGNSFSVVPGGADRPLGTDRVIWGLSPDTDSNPNSALRAWWSKSHGGNV